jgi:hypothetical protein
VLRSLVYVALMRRPSERSGAFLPIAMRFRLASRDDSEPAWAAEPD